MIQGGGGGRVPSSDPSSVLNRNGTRNFANRSFRERKWNFRKTGLLETELGTFVNRDFREPGLLKRNGSGTRSWPPVKFRFDSERNSELSRCGTSGYGTRFFANRNFRKRSSELPRIGTFGNGTRNFRTSEFFQRKRSDLKSESPGSQKRSVLKRRSRQRNSELSRIGTPGNGIRDFRKSGLSQIGTFETERKRNSILAPRKVLFWIGTELTVGFSKKLY